MLYAYVDESERNEDFYFLGALICDLAQRDALTASLDEVMRKHAAQFPEIAGAELHGSEMMRAGTAPWRGIPIRMRIAIYSDALRAIAASGARLYIEGIDVAAQRAKGYPNLTPARELAFSHLFERINTCGGPELPVRVIADQHHTAETSRSNFLRYRERGTYGYRSSKLPHIHPTIDFVDSKAHRPLQGADLTTYIFNRISTVQESDERAAAAKRDMWALVDPCISWGRGRARIWP